MFKGKYSWAAEALGGVLLFLLPLKFGALVSIPAITMIYWTDPVSLIVASWPGPVFPVLSAIFLLFSLLFVPGHIFSGKSGFFALLWIGLSLAAVAGIAAEGTPPDAWLYYLNHAFSIGAFLTGISHIVNHNRRICDVYYGIFTAAFCISLVIGLNQYFSGYETTIANIQESRMGMVNDKILARLQEMRVTGGFSACNAYAGYLVLGLPVALGCLWKAGNKVSPPQISRIVFTVPVLTAGLFLLIKTGSRGGLLSLFSALFFLLFSAKMKWKYRFALLGMIPAGIAGLTALVMLGRGGKSILFRLDYLQGAFRMMLESPLNGMGWGGFQRQFMKMKWILDAEAPASPHNFPLSFGSQCGIFGFLLACIILGMAFYVLFRHLSKGSLRENFENSRLIGTLSFAGVCGWGIHSLQEVLYETPGAVIPFGVIVILAFAQIPAASQEDKMPSSEKKQILFLCLTLCYGVAALYLSGKTLLFDSSLAALNDMTDYRMIPKEKLILINDSDVASVFEKARNFKPDSPFPYLSVSDFAAAKGDFGTALSMTRKAAELDPFSSGYQQRLYKMLKYIGQEKEAEIHLRRAAELFPMNPDLQDLLKQEAR